MSPQQVVRTARAVAVLACLFGVSAAGAQRSSMGMQPAAPSSTVQAAIAKPTTIQNVDAAGVAMKGFDAVAYFTMATPTKGTAEFVAQHNGATFRFASAANRDAFVKAPEKYAPQYGGYCAMGVAYNGKFDIDPDAWKIENGKLYLNKDMKTQRMWFNDIPGNITKADNIWPVLGARK